jgi:hypothetical protein
MQNEIPTYKAFWPYYVAEHQKKLNRNLHFTGTALAMLALVFAVVTSNAWLLLFAPVAAYGFAFAGHHWVEKNRSSSLQYPLWSLLADLQMFAFMCLGRMDREVKRMGVLNAEI